MRLSVVTSNPPRTEDVDGIPSQSGLYRAKAISEQHIAGLIANAKDATEKARAISAMQARDAEYKHEGKVYAHVLGELRLFDESTGEVGPVVEIKRWAEPFAFERIVCTLTPSL